MSVVIHNNGRVNITSFQCHKPLDQPSAQQLTKSMRQPSGPVPIDKVHGTAVFNTAHCYTLEAITNYKIIIAHYKALTLRIIPSSSSTAASERLCFVENE